MQEMKENMRTRLENIKKLEDNNFKLKDQVEFNKIVEKDQEERIDKLYEIIEGNKERISELEKENELLSGDLSIANNQLEANNKEKSNIEEKLAIIEKDRLLLKEECEKLRVFEYELYNKVVK